MPTCVRVRGIETQVTMTDDAATENSEDLRRIRARLSSFPVVD